LFSQQTKERFLILKERVNSTMLENPVTITPKAKEQVSQIIAKKQVPEGYGLRIGLKGAGCGASYSLGFDKPRENDLVYDLGNFQLLIDKRHFMYLFDLELDFEERENEQGFVFNKLNGA